MILAASRQNDSEDLRGETDRFAIGVGPECAENLSKRRKSENIDQLKTKTPVYWYKNVDKIYGFPSWNILAVPSSDVVTTLFLS